MTTSPLPDRISGRAGAVGLALTVGQVQQLSKYYELLSHWNRTVNLTSLKLEGFPDATIDRIILEPIVSKRLIGIESGVWFDFGSGSGSPALPLKVLCPGTELIMVESRSRKCAFLREAVRHLQLTGASVWTGRIENLSTVFAGGMARLVTVRAVRFDDALLKTSALMLTSGGVLAAFGASIPPDVQPFPFSHGTTTSLLSGASAIHCFVRHPREESVPRGTPGS